MTLLSASAYTGTYKELYVKNISTYDLEITSTIPDLIDGQSAQTLTQWASIRLLTNDGTNSVVQVQRDGNTIGAKTASLLGFTVKRVSSVSDNEIDADEIYVAVFR